MSLVILDFMYICDSTLKKIFFNVYFLLREREREHMSEGDTESKAGSRLRAVSTEPDAGLELMNPEIMP